MSHIDTEFAKANKRFNLIFRIAIGSIAVVFIVTVAFWVLVGTVAVKSADEVEKVGLKAVVERIWCGPDNKCL